MDQCYASYFACCHYVFCISLEENNISLFDYLLQSAVFVDCSQTQIHADCTRSKQWRIQGGGSQGCDPPYVQENPFFIIRIQTNGNLPRTA